jgi:hypothetical protein
MFEQALYYVSVQCLSLDGWFVEVQTETGEIVHTTLLHPTEAKAICAAQRWVWVASIAEEPKQ